MLAESASIEASGQPSRRAGALGARGEHVVPGEAARKTGTATFNPLIEALSPPPIPEVLGWSRAYDGRFGPLINLSQAVPGYPPHDRLLAWLAEAAGSAECARYGDIEGDPELRQAYARQVSDLYHAGIGPEHVHVTAGCNQAFVVTALALAAAGETVLLTEPFYFNQETSLQMLGIGVDYVRCDGANGFLPRIEDVRSRIRPGVRALAIVTPNNPTGAVYPPGLLAALYEACREAGIWLIVDETYRDFLAGGGRPHDLFQRPGWQETLIGLYSFSKSFCIPGHRLGVITAGAEAVRQIAKIMDNLQICASRTPQVAIAKALTELGSWQDANRHEIARRAGVLVETLAQCPGWQVEAIGAYFAFVRHPFAGKTSFEVAHRLAAERGIVTIPGACFGRAQDGYLRFAFANAGTEVLRTLADRLPVA